MRSYAICDKHVDNLVFVIFIKLILMSNFFIDVERQSV